MPRKRFTRQPVLQKGAEYLGIEQSYAQTVQHEGMPIMYDDRTSAKDHREPAEGRQPVGLAPSTVWRWLSWLGGMPGTLRAAWELIRQKEPNATLHRQLWVVSPKKYRSEQRRDTLVRAMQLLAADRVCQGTLGQGIFPRYAISQGWS